jgi:transposase
LGTIVMFGVEGTGSYGIGLARFLRRHGRKVVEVSRPPRAGERRLSGKSDVIDAEHSARTVLAGTATAIPKLADSQVESIRLLKIVRDTAVKAHKTAIIALKATLVTAHDELRAELEGLTDHKLILACTALVAPGDLSDPDAAMRHTLHALRQALARAPRGAQDPHSPPQGPHQRGGTRNARGVRSWVRHRRRDAPRRR